MKPFKSVVRTALEPREGPLAAYARDYLVPRMNAVHDVDMYVIGRRPAIPESSMRLLRIEGNARTQIEHRRVRVQALKADYATLLQGATVHRLDAAFYRALGRHNPAFIASHKAEEGDHLDELDDTRRVIRIIAGGWAIPWIARSAEVRGAVAEELLPHAQKRIYALQRRYAGIGRKRNPVERIRLLCGIRKIISIAASVDEGRAREMQKRARLWGLVRCLPAPYLEILRIRRLEPKTPGGGGHLGHSH